MDGKKQKHQPTGSSFVDELFGPKDRHDAKPAPGGGFFSTVFPPPSASQTTWNDGSRGNHVGEEKAAQGNGSSGSYAATGTTSESPYFGLSSVHYGGRDYVYVYVDGHGQQDHRSHLQTTPPSKKNNDDSKQQPDGSAATRGDWWQGSLYY